jgi:demethoxyubiquinone hydroxylase (CLK1/Coq7/Cat5 family)
MRQASAIAKCGSELEKEVWDHFANDQALLKQTASAIRSHLGSSKDDEKSLDEDAEDGADEGRILARIHKNVSRCAPDDV